jgi:isopentenyl phosphate kinase
VQALVLASVDHVLKEFLDDGIGFIGRPLSDKCNVGLTRRDSLSLVKAFLFFLGVSRGDISLFQRERSEIMKGDELQISAKGLH